MLSERLLDHFQNPRNAGVLESPEAVSVTVTNPACGDILNLAVRIQDGIVAEVRYQTRGCTAAIASGSALTELMLGLGKSGLAALRAADVDAAVGGLQPASRHAAVLCEDGVRALLQKF
jgi:nitrogen fixation NifU-like protein